MIENKIQEIVVENEENIRIDAYLSKKLEMSRVAIKRLLENEKIYVNKKIVKPSYKIQLNDVIMVENEEPTEISIKAQDIPIKVLGFDSGVNVTVGLPCIRTSVDHGTAFPVAGTGKASENSMLEALRLGAQMAKVKFHDLLNE